MSFYEQYKEYTSSASAFKEPIYGHVHYSSYDTIKLYFEPSDKVLVINWSHENDGNVELILGLDIDDSLKTIQIVECWYQNSNYELDGRTHADGFVHTMMLLKSRNNTGIATCFGPFFGPDYHIHIFDDGSQYIVDPISQRTKEVAAELVELLTGGNPYLFRIRKSVAATIIQKWFKGWIARRAHRYNPYTTLARHLILKEFKEFNLLCK